MGREKPGKPRRPRPAEWHAHPGWSLDDVPQPGGWQADSKLFEELTGAAFEGCTTCQDVLLTLLVEDSVTTARLVEMACGAIIDLEGELPASQVDPDAPGEASREFRRLARAGLGTSTDGMYRECGQMTPAERRAAANTALDTLVGYAAMNPREGRTPFDSKGVGGSWAARPGDDVP
ncbi:MULTISPECIES: hypothetical protein [Actinomycetes]|uniref:hypothetical protein n=1 Tax=Actinomycetes TaxID=1760 RepID=UPI0015E138FF|nr:hypothetical protein [Streptomyces noursei]